MDDLFNNLYGTDVTVISNEFLNQYLADTKPEYIKVFLFYLWKGIKEKYTIAMTSSEIDLPESTVEMALKFWVKKKLMKKECLLKNLNANTEITNLLNFQDKKQELIKKNRKAFCDIEKSLLFVAEKLLGQPLSPSQQDLINKCYNEYNFDEGLIQYFLEYCGSINKTNTNYMRKLAEDWYELHITTAEAAKNYIDSFTNAKPKHSKSKGNVKALDRDEDFDKVFYDSISNGKFK